MKKTASKKNPIADTVAKLKEAQTATEEKIATLDAMRISARHNKERKVGKDFYVRAESVTRYLDHAASDAMKRTKHILPNVADVKAHPLPAWQDLTATPVSKRTLAEVTDEITDYLADEYRFAAPGMMHGLEDFLTWYQGTFLEALRRLTEQKIATAETLGKTNAKKKLVEAFAALPSFHSTEAFDDYCQRILKRDAADPTDEIVRQWREGKPSPFPSPEAFKDAFRRALMLDAEATAEVNRDKETAQQGEVLNQIKENTDELVAVKRKTSREQRANGFKQASHLHDWNAENKNDKQVAELKLVAQRDEKDYPEISTPRPYGYWKDLWQAAPSFPSADAVRKAVIRKRTEPRGKYPREGKKRGQYKRRVQ